MASRQKAFLMTVLSIATAAPCDGPEISELLHRSYTALLAAALPAITLGAARSFGLSHLLRGAPERLYRGGGGWTHVTPFGRAGLPGVGHVRHVACDPDSLRQGVAGAIMRRVFDSARAAGVERLCCLSALSAEPFYRAMGFDGGAEVAMHLSPEVIFPAVEMRR